MKKKMQMVEDDQIENVGIMAGFMDDIEEMMAEIEDEMSEKEGDSNDMTRLMDRRPDSPEVLMNNLRGDYRSIDARREELADMVGYNVAAETPDEVLALLQPVLMQQGVAALPVGSPPQGAGMGPPPAVAPQFQSPSGMEGGVEGLSAMMPPPGPQAGPPVQMAKGGIVQYFQDGSDEAGVTPAEMDAFAAYPPEIVAAAKQRFMQMLMGQQPQAEPVDLMARTKELTPQYAELLGTGDKEAMRSQMLFDIAQAALGFAGNVSPQGQPLTGSFAARLAGATSALPGQMAARAAEMRKGDVQARLAAMQQAQGEISTAQAQAQADRDFQQQLMLEAIKGGSKLSFTPMTEEQMVAFKIPEAERDMPWVLGSDGKPVIAGGRPPASTTINVGEGKLDPIATSALGQLDDQYIQANSSLVTLNNVAEIKPLLEEEDSLFTGPFSTAAVYVSRVAKVLGVEGENTKEALSNTVATMQRLAEFELAAAQAMRGQGQITENERALIRRASAGELDKMTASEIKTLVGALEKTANWRIGQYNAKLAQFKEVYANDPVLSRSLRLYDLTTTPMVPTTDSTSQAESILNELGLLTPAEEQELR